MTTLSTTLSLIEAIQSSTPGAVFSSESESSSSDSVISIFGIVIIVIIAVVVLIVSVCIVACICGMVICARTRAGQTHQMNKCKCKSKCSCQCFSAEQPPVSAHYVTVPPATARYVTARPPVHIPLQSHGRIQYIDHINNIDNSEVESTARIIQKLCERTWKDSLTGTGADARGLHHLGLDIKEVSSVRNVKLFQQYQVGFSELSQRYHLPKELQTEPIASDHALRDIIQRTPLSDFSITDDSAAFINLGKLRQGETLLFHGTTRANMEGIITNGFDLSKCKRGPYGHPGFYLAESSQKADQYTDPQHNRSGQGQKLYLLVVRVALGRTEMFVNNKIGEKYDTIVGGTDKRFREFVVTDTTHIYPQFVVEYERV